VVDGKDVQCISADLIPPVRLGRLLRQRRQDLGWSQAELASLHGLDVADLDAVEAGVALIDEGTVALVESVYGIAHRSIVPQRAELVIDVDEGTIAAAEHQVDLGGATHGEQVLTRYVALVYALRGLPVGSTITFRDIDLAVLGRALDADTGGVEERLHAMVSEHRPELWNTASVFRRAAVVPVAGLLVGLTAIGGLVLVQRSAGAPAVHDPPPADQVGLTLGVDGAPAHPSLGANTEIADAVVIERPSSGAVLPRELDIGQPAVLDRHDAD